MDYTSLFLNAHCKHYNLPHILQRTHLDDEYDLQMSKKSKVIKILRELLRWRLSEFNVLHVQNCDARQKLAHVCPASHFCT